MLGAKAHWNVFDWDKSKRKKEALLISEAIVTTEKKKLTQYQSSKEMENEITKLQEIITLMQRLFPYGICQNQLMRNYEMA
jgi:hypothetical protein